MTEINVPLKPKLSCKITKTFTLKLAQAKAHHDYKEINTMKSTSSKCTKQYGKNCVNICCKLARFGRIYPF